MRRLEPVQLAHQCVTINPPRDAPHCWIRMLLMASRKGISNLQAHAHKKSVVEFLKGDLQGSRKCVLVELRSGDKSMGLGPRLIPDEWSQVHRRPVACRCYLLRPMK
jgi:hypothetical protein